MNEVPLDLQTKLTLLKMNPVLKKDFHFMKFAARGLLNFADMESNSADGTYYKQNWRSVAENSLI